MHYRLGVDLGGTKTEVIVLDSDQRAVYRERRDSPAHSYEAMLDNVCDMVRVAETEIGQRISVGIGLPGAISPETGRLRNSSTACLIQRPLQSDIEQRLERQIRIENDANCFVLSEALGGAGEGYPVVFGVIIGTGTGGGIVVDGKLLRGPHAISGEWGHNPLPWLRPEDGSLDCYCGQTACIETFLSGTGLANHFNTRFGERLSSRQILESAGQGDPRAVTMLEAYHDQLARALALVINILDPHVIVLGGGMSNIESIYEQVPARLADYVFSDFVGTPILKATRGDASGVFGAALLWE